MTTGNSGRGGPEWAQHLRMVVSDLWTALGEGREVDTHHVLRRVSQEMEQLARLLEAGTV